MKLERGPSKGFFDLVATFMLHWGVAFTLTVTTLALTFFLYVPDWTFTPPSSTPQIMLNTEARTVPTLSLSPSLPNCPLAFRSTPQLFPMV